MNKRRLSQASLLRLPICFFPGREKAKWFRLRICFFRGQEKAKWFRLRICFFPTREKAKWFRLPICFFSRAGKKQNGQTSNLLFPAREKAKWFRLPICFFPSREKQNGSDFQFAFSRPGKKQNGSDCLETSSACGTRATLSIRLQRSESHAFFPGFTKENWMSSLLFRLKLPICFFPGRPGKKQKAQTSNLLFPWPGKSKMAQTAA